MDVLESSSSSIIKTNQWQFCKGTRVFYFASEENALLCDHSSEHNLKWRQYSQLPSRNVEVGTLTEFYTLSDPLQETLPNHEGISDICARVIWDCGTERIYSYARQEWETLRALDFGPAGYTATAVLCDVCFQPLTGFSFRCRECSPFPITIYDLCYRHYNAGEHNLSHTFQRIIPNGYSAAPSEGNVLPLRADSTCYQLIGIFPGAHVAPLDRDANPLPPHALTGHWSSQTLSVEHASETFPPPMKRKRMQEEDLEVTRLDGKVIRILHDSGEKERQKAKFWKCVAEVDWEPDRTDKQCKLEYWHVGRAGMVTLKATVPAIGGNLYADHFPQLDFAVMNEISKYRSNVRQMKNGEEYFLYASEQVGRQPVMELNINNTELAELPQNDAEFWSKWPGKLGVLNLMHNKLNTLPNLGSSTCSSLQVLCLSFNSFTVAPEEAFQCHQLINFNMIANQLRSIPTSLSKFTCLVNLFLGYNSLQWLPDVFHRLPQLQTAGFEHNFLASLPHTFSNLKKLVRLDLGSNRFTSVPDVLFELPSLRMLQLSNNRIQVIPKAMETLAKALTSLQLDENPLQLATLRECPDSQKLDALRECAWPDVQPRKGLRVLALGKCGSGKTSLVKAITQGEYVTPIEGNKHEHTIGIKQYFKTLNINHHALELTLWDFAGENTYAMMNQLFLSDGTLVWIVVNLEDYHKGSYYESLGIWLGSTMARMSRPVVWIVGTHADRFSESELRRLQADLENRVRKECTGCAELIANQICAYKEQLASAADDPFSVTQKQLKQLEVLQEGGANFLQENYRVILLSNTYSFKGQMALLDELQKLPTVFHDLLEVLPDEWVAATEKLQRCGVKDLSMYQPPIIELNEVHWQLGGILNSAQEVDNLISYLHQSGEIIKLAEGKVLLDVLWLVDLLKEIFRHNLMESIRGSLPRLKKSMTEDAIEKALDDFEAGKVIRRDLLEALWSPLGISKCSFPLVVRLLQEFGLAYEVTTQSGCCGYLFPWLLQSQVTLAAGDQFTKQESKHITVRYDFIHYVPGFFERFLTCCYPMLEFGEIGRYATESISVHELVTHVTAGSDSVSVRIVGRQNRGTGDTLCHSEKIEVNASGNSDMESYDPVWKVMMQLIGMFEKFLSNERRDKFERSVLCPKCVDASYEKPKLFHFELQYPGPHHLKEYHRCSKCTRRTGKTTMVAVEKLIPKQEFLLGFQPQEYYTEGKLISIPSLEQLKILDLASSHGKIPMDRNDCLELCKFIQGTGWPMLARHLGQPEGWIQSVKETCMHSPPSEAPFKLLHTWLQTEGKNATIYALAEAMKQCRYTFDWIEGLRRLLVRKEVLKDTAD